MAQGVAYRDRAVFVGETLVLADLHIGADAASDVEFRLGEREDLTQRFEALVEAFDPAELVVAGDLLHSFGSLPEGVPETVRSLRAIADDAGARMVVTPGNHDTMLGEIWDGPTRSEYRVDDTVILHGHEPPASNADADRYVIGHDHPVIEIEGQRHPCYLYGPGTYRGGDVVMLPAFTRLMRGSTVNGMSGADFQSPLVPDADGLRPVVRDETADESLEFPALGSFRQML